MSQEKHPTLARMEGILKGCLFMPTILHQTLMPEKRNSQFPGISEYFIGGDVVGRGEKNGEADISASLIVLMTVVEDSSDDNQ